MSFPWPLAKLDCINRALARTGDNLVNVADDGSDEWTVCSPAYDSGLSYAMENGSWGYNALVVTLNASPTPPQDTNWDTAYPIPNDCVHIIWLKINQIIPSTPNSNLPALTLWDILGTPTGPVIVTNARGGPPPPSGTVTPAQITLKYISNQGALCDVTNGTPTLVEALVRFVMSGIYQGLHEDIQAGKSEEQAARMLLQEARTRYDQQKPKRQMFNSRITAARRIRRPWPPVGNDNWGGSGIPG